VTDRSVEEIQEHRNHVVPEAHCLSDEHNVHKAMCKALDYQR
jgi:hypothetical protein